jgi:Flp pilus assembly secretin CpaC
MNEFFADAKLRITMKHKNSTTVALAAGFLFAAALSLETVQTLHADDAIQSQTITLDAGQTRVIDHLKKDSKAAIRVIENPHALVIHDETPGQLVLLGADRGQWVVTVTREDGAKVAYHVDVAAIADSSNPLDAETGPVASDGTLAKPAASAADATTGESGGASETVLAAHVVDASTANDAPQENSLANDGPPAAQLPVNSQTASAVAGSPSSRYRSDPPVGDHERPVSTARNYLPDDVISLMSGASEIVDFPHRMKRISIADSTVADIQVTSPYQLNLIGHKPGFTTLAVWDDQGRYVERQVRIDTGGTQQVMLNAIVAELDRTKLETQGIDFSIALAKSGISLSSLPGQVATPYGPTSQLTGGTGAVPGVAPIGGQLLPLLLSGAMTYGLSTSNSSYSTQSLFQFLESHNLGRILAQPHLLANSGQSASFLSGGEIPIVLAQALNTSIVFKQFGTLINFRPTVVGRHEVELLVKTEVSEPDFAHGVQLFGFSVPAFVTRKADTMVRLKDGQTLIIAGLILHNRNAVVRKVPYLGDLPYAGAIFRNTSWQDSETDLVMSVQPQIVGPLPPNAQVFEPSTRGPLTQDEIRTQRLATPDAARPRF